MSRTVLFAIAALMVACSSAPDESDVGYYSARVTSADILDPDTKLDGLDLYQSYADSDSRELVRRHWLRGLGVARDRGLAVDLSGLEIRYVDDPCGHADWNGCYSDAINVRIDRDDYGSEVLIQGWELVLLYHEFGHRWSPDAEIGPYTWTIAGLLYEWELTGDDELAIAMADVAIGPVSTGWWSAGFDARYERGIVGALRFYLGCDGDPECAIRSVASSSGQELVASTWMSEAEFNAGPCAVWQSMWFELLSTDGLPLDEHRREMLRGFILDAC